MTDEARDSQQEPKHDSRLQTPQADQPMPTEAQRVQPDEDAEQPGVDNEDADQAAAQPRVEVDVNVDNPAAPSE